MISSANDCDTSSRLEYDKSEDLRRSNGSGFGDGDAVDGRCETRCRAAAEGGRAVLMLPVVAERVGGSGLVVALFASVIFVSRFRCGCRCVQLGYYTLSYCRE